MRWLDALERLIAGPGAAAGTSGGGGSEISDVRGLWQAWTQMSYPRRHRPEADAAIVDGADLADLDRDMAGLFELHFDRGLNELEHERLSGFVRTLERVVPQLRGDGRPYFAAALAVGRWIVRGSPT